MFVNMSYFNTVAVSVITIDVFLRVVCFRSDAISNGQTEHRQRHDKGCGEHKLWYVTTISDASICLLRCW